MQPPKNGFQNQPENSENTMMQDPFKQMQS